jgi:hypothetical protein
MAPWIFNQNAPQYITVPPNIAAVPVVVSLPRFLVFPDNPPLLKAYFCSELLSGSWQAPCDTADQDHSSATSLPLSEGPFS